MYFYYKNFRKKNDNKTHITIVKPIYSLLCSESKFILKVVKYAYTYFHILILLLKNIFSTITTIKNYNYNKATIKTYRLFIIKSINLLIISYYTFV